MKKLTFILVVLFFFQLNVFSQPCLPDGITFLSQAEIDNFPTNYPDCTVIEGWVSVGTTIQESDITNFYGLNSITSIEGGLSIINNTHLKNLAGLNNITSTSYIIIEFNDSLENLSGLDNLQTIGGELKIFWNQRLMNLSGLESLTSIEGKLYLSSNYALNSLSGLNSLTNIGGRLALIYNFSLGSISALSNVTYIGGNIWIDRAALWNLDGLQGITTINGNLSLWENGLLSNLSGLDNITSISGVLGIIDNDLLTDLTALNNLNYIGSHLYIKLNDSLTNLFGLENIVPASISDLEIFLNTNLSICDVESICNYLANPFGQVEIHDNDPGCNSEEEILAACDTVSVKEVFIEENITISPNPCSDKFSVNYSVFESKTVYIDLFDISGKKLKNLFNDNVQPGSQVIEFDVAELKEGVYFCTLQTNDKIITKKLIIN